MRWPSVVCCRKPEAWKNWKPWAYFKYQVCAQFTILMTNVSFHIKNNNVHFKSICFSVILIEIYNFRKLLGFEQHWNFNLSQKKLYWRICTIMQDTSSGKKKHNFHKKYRFGSSQLSTLLFTFTVCLLRWCILYTYLHIQLMKSKNSVAWCFEHSER
jgi:hypothetical protein